MREQLYKGNHFLLYDSIQELPVDNFFKFNLNLTLNAGIGGDIQAIMERQAELKEWIRRGRKKEALQAVNNMENTIAAIMAGVNPETNAFVCMVHSCNGEKVTDLSQEGMNRYLKKWSKKGFTIGKLKGWLIAAKKNFDFEIEQFFPEVGNSAQAISRSNILKRRTIAALKFIQGKGEYSAVKILDDILIELVKPHIYVGSEGVEVLRTHGFEDAMVVIRKELNIHDPQMSAYQFLKHSKTVKEIFANRKKANKK